MPFYAPRLQSSLKPLFLAVVVVVSSTTQSLVLSSPMDSSVKLRVDHASGHCWGTGTIIDTRQGPEGQEALILTCGHIFRESQGQGNVEVHLYGENSSVRVYGRCLHYDLEIDLALVIIAPPNPVRAAPIAPEGYQIQPNQQAWSVGCDSGNNPTVQTHQVLSVDRFFKAQDNRKMFYYVHVSGAPVGGRSGGGLFSADGYLIGVCNTGDPTANDGHFVPPHMIRHVLAQTLPQHVYHNLPTPAPPALVALAPLAPIESISHESISHESIAATPPMSIASLPEPIVADNFADNRDSMSLEERASLEEIERRIQDGDEVIVIIRPRRSPESRSDVIRLNDTSSQFLDALVNRQPQLANQTAERQPASFSVRH